jgi:hypothetical protein
VSPEDLRALAASLETLVVAINDGALDTATVTRHRLEGAAMLAAVLAEGAAVDVAALVERLGAPPD